jgi:hypothetical protein
MLLMLPTFIGIINYLELSHELIELNDSSIPRYESSELQNDILNDDLSLLLLLSPWPLRTVDQPIVGL